MVGTVAEPVIQFPECFDVFLLMAEHFNHFLSIHHFFNKSVHFSKIRLLFYKIITGRSCHFFCCRQHYADHQECCNGKRYIEDDHAYEDTDNCDCAVDNLWNTLADHLAKRIDIVRINRHDISMCMRIKIADGKLLHLSKKLIPEIPQRPLCHINHHTVLDKGCCHSDQIKPSDPEDSRKKRTKIRMIRKKQRTNVIIDQCFHKHRSLYTGKHADKNRNDCYNTMRGVIL